MELTRFTCQSSNLVVVYTFDRDYWPASYIMDPATGVLEGRVIAVPVKCKAVSSHTAQVSTSRNSFNLMHRVGIFSMLVNELVKANCTTYTSVGKYGCLLMKEL